MANRISRTLLENTAKRALEAAGYRWNAKPWSRNGEGRNVADVGSCHLAKGAAGWDIHQMANEGGGIRQINGWCNSLSAREMLVWLEGLELGASNVRLALADIEARYAAADGKGA